jgi:hypothetical protein
MCALELWQFHREMAEKIIQRSGNVNDRKNANKALGTVGALQAEYKSTKETVRTCQEKLNLEMNRLEQSEKTISSKRDKLSLIQEAIDSDYLPEGAQPLSRIQARDGLKMVSHFLSLLFCVSHPITGNPTIRRNN